MPRFLDTTTGQFVWVDDISRIHYAILSHTWRSESDGGEQSYQDVLRLQAVAQWSPPEPDVTHKPGTLPGLTHTATPTSILSHPSLSEKIKGICRVAKEAGYALVWVDSCCIDKSSSAELSEAINSMFRWYALADVCYAYMADVHDSILPPLSGSYSFRSSKWHTRGWTLQELIAPKRVVFLSSAWRFLGTKMSLATVLESVTRIDAAVLTGVAPLESISVARRMSWAAERRTTRLEDEAYCLLGIFGVHMSPIYGEGYSAFIRLQKAIISTIPDQTIFALWIAPGTAA
ncbi:heterokaryon incompatibility protein-domain-containing protein [Trametes meyenii]|nr:heterokaryon incompatibility protein-domain-containing protein [Trametes meyenii]